ncbi:MAG: hypothetical protein ABSF71_07325 [Terriglobia bacterium]|jgi:hypothetical protein
MKLGRIVAALWLAVGLLVGPRPTSAEEITLKDGQKIVGTIVGYENDMFRVETAFGVALIRKDKVASIQMSKPEAAIPPAPSRPATKGLEPKPGSVAAAPEATPAPASFPPASPSPATNSMDAPVPTKSPEPLPVIPRVNVPVSIKPPEPPPLAVRHLPDPAHLSNWALAPMLGPAPTVTAPTPPPPPPVSHPVDVPMPAHLEEHVDGNTYFSDTFRFSMFKPPDWKIYEGVPKETGSGIMAMGTDDEQTLLIVDRQVWSGAAKLSSNDVDANLRQTYQEYHRISEDAFEYDGHTATRRTFSGVLDGAEWHGVAVHVIHGNMVFGIFGLTSAETFQFQEAIFNKIIRTFHFLAPAPSAETPIAKPTP